MITQERPTTVARWPVVRIEAGHTVTVQLLSSEFVRLVTHFHRSTFLCPEVEECDACKLLPGRPYWYLPAVIQPGSRHGILELSAHACSDLEQKVRFVGLVLRPGVQVELSRRTKKAPIRIEINGQAPNPPAAQLAEWVTPLMALYRLPALRAGETLESYGERVKVSAIQRANLIAGQMKAAAGGRSSGR
jgi:hypothetical protein